MARRKELQGVCNDLLDNFVSRYNDLDGYWVLGKFQRYLTDEKANELCFSLFPERNAHAIIIFNQTLTFYRTELKRHLKIRAIPIKWVKKGQVMVQQASGNRLASEVLLITDLGTVYTSKRTLTVNPHDPTKELRRSKEHYGPGTQKDS